MKDSAELLVTDEGPNVDLLLQEFKQAGVMPNGWYDLAFNQEQRRMIWAGQAPDGRRWDENQPEGQPARPWDGSADARVPMIDGVVNDDVALLSMAFEKGELRATAVNPDRIEQASAVSAYLHWMVRTKYRRDLNLETELSAQYSREHGWCVAYVGWEREICKRPMKLTMDQVVGMGQPQAPAPEQEQPEQGPSPEQQLDTNPAPDISQMLLDPAAEELAAEMFRSWYRMWVVQTFADKGFYADELEQESILDLSLSSARRYVRELREKGETEVAVPYISKNQPLVRVLQPYLEILSARGTMMLQESRAIFWRRWMTEAQLMSKAAEGWDSGWIDEVKKTMGNIASWAGALGATSLTGPSTKTVGNTTYLKVTEENNPLIEVVYAYVKKVDDAGVQGVWETIFSPHITKLPGGTGADFYAKHELVNYSHGLYPFMEYKRENIGRALTDTRSVAEVAGTWQNEEKGQRDMLFNRAQWDTLPPIRVPKLGGVEYRLGPGAQVPLGRSETIEGLGLNVPAPSLALELIQMLRLQADDYFGRSNPSLDPGRAGAKQGKAVRDFYAFWGEVMLHMFALTLQYNPQEVVRVTGSPELAALDAATVMDEFDIGLEFDVQELNPDYLLKKLQAVHERVLPADAGGVIDRSALTNLELKMLDPRLAQKVLMDKGQASQKIYRDTMGQVIAMAQGNEAEYVENDPTAGMKLQSLQTIIQHNPKYQQWMQSDQRFQELLKTYVKNLQMSVQQQQNKQVGRIGVKPVADQRGPEAALGPGMGPGMAGMGPGMGNGAPGGGGY